MRRGFPLIPGALAASALVAACFGPTEIRLEITSNASCHDLQTGDTLFFVASTDHQSDTPVTETHDCHEQNGLSTVGSLVLVPSGDRTARVSIEVVSSLGKSSRDCTPGHLDGCIVARRRLNFRRHEQVELPIEMRVECIGIDCAESETCVLGTCRSADTAASLFCDETTCDAGAALPNEAGDAADAADAAVMLDAGADTATSEASAPLPCPGAESAPLRIATNAGAAAYTLFATASDLFWADPVGGDVWSLPKAGGTATRWATGENAARSVVRDSSLVYWTALAGLRLESTPNTATTAVTQTIENGGGPMVANSSGGVYWFDTDTNQIMFTTASAGGPSTRTLTTGASISAYDMAFDGTNVYWTNRGAMPGVFRIAGSASNQAPVLFADALTPIGVAIEGANVYWTDGGNVVSRPKSQASAAQMLATGQDTPYAVAVSGGDVYFTNAGHSPAFAGTVARVSTSGGAVTTLASGRSPAGITVDARCVYWLQRDVGEVWKASR